MQFDERTETLTLNEAVRAIEPIPRRLLWRMLCEGGIPVPKEVLIAAAWSSTRGLSDASFYNAIKRLRETLGPFGPSLIVLEPGRGYRITAPVAAEPSPEPARPVLMLQAGDAVPRRAGWRLVMPLGDSPYRDVWLASHEQSGERHVFRFAETETRLAALRSQAAASSTLRAGANHAGGFVLALTLDDSTPPFWLESTYAGRPLPEWLAECDGAEALPMRARITLMAKLARIVAAAHCVGVPHGNVRPEKILVDDAPDPDVHGGPTLRLAGFTGDTGPASVSFPFRPPELARGQPATQATDVYGLGILLYQLVAGDFGKPLAAGWEADIADPLLQADIEQAAAGDPGRRLQAASMLADRLETLEDRTKERAREQAHAEECARLRQTAEAHRVEALLAAERASLNERLADRTRKAAALCLGLAIIAVAFAGTAMRARHVAASQSHKAQRTTRIVEDTLEGVIGGLASDLRDRSGVTLAMRHRILDQAAARLADMRALDPADARLSRLEASALTEFSNTYLQEGDLDAARQSAARAVELRKSLLSLAPADEALQSALAESLHRLGDAQLRARDLHGARASYDESLSLALASAVRRPGDEALQRSLAVAYESTGRILDEQGDSKAALEVYEKVADIAQQGLVAHPGDTSWQELWATAQIRRGDALQERGRIKDALAANQAGLAMRSTLSSRDPSNMRWLRDLAVAWMDVGDEQAASGEHAAARSSYEKALSLQQKLSGTDPSNTSWHSDVALAESDVADEAAASGDMAAASRHYESGISRLRDLADAEAADISLQHILFVLENNYAYNLGKARRGADAKSHVVRALAVAERLQKLRPDDPFNKTALNEVHETAQSLGYLLLPGN